MWKILLVIAAVLASNEPPRMIGYGVTKAGFATEAECKKAMDGKEITKITHDMAADLSKKLNGTKVIVKTGCVDTSKTPAPKAKPDDGSI
jgi:hypothetical protein